VRTLKTFQGTHILGASRGLLCDSYAVLLYLLLVLRHFDATVLANITDYYYLAAQTAAEGDELLFVDVERCVRIVVFGNHQCARY